MTANMIRKAQKLDDNTGIKKKVKRGHFLKITQVHSLCLHEEHKQKVSPTDWQGAGFFAWRL